MNIWMLFLGVLSVSFLARYKKLDSVNYETFFAKSGTSLIKGKKVLMLGEDFSVYKDNKLATPFLNWNLSKDIFQHPDYYENVLFVNKAFTNDPPQIIFDKENLFKSYLDRIPQLKEAYKETSEGVYQKRN